MFKNEDEVLKAYQIKKFEINKRLDEFKEIIRSSDERIFAELAFCICTPQSKAILAWRSISSLIENKLLYNGTEEKIKPFLNSVRFCDNKAKYIINARNFFSNDKLEIKNKILNFDNSFELRDWLVKNIKGIGLKEASHFIRNIGFDYENQLAILDRHILKNLKMLGVVDNIQTLTERIYLEIEMKMKEFSKKLCINLYELDILFWSEETGTIFK